jgi:ribose transport system substrate-binding protein
VAPHLDRAVEAGIQVITFDSDAPTSKRHTHYGMDNRRAARLALSTLAKLLGEQGKIAVQTAMFRDANGQLQLNTSTAYVDRMAGIEEELAHYPEIELVATAPCIGNDVADGACATEVEAVLAEHPDLDGFLFARGKLLRELDLATNAPSLTERVSAGTIRSVASTHRTTPWTTSTPATPTSRSRRSSSAGATKS